MQLLECLGNLAAFLQFQGIQINTDLELSGKITPEERSGIIQVGHQLPEAAVMWIGDLAHLAIIP